MNTSPVGLYQISLKVILKRPTGEILACKARPDASYAGFYDFPGGRIQEDEFTVPLYDILAREIAEEVGDIRYELSPAPVAVGRHSIAAEKTKAGKEILILQLFYEATYLGGEIRASEEHTGFEWIDPRTRPLEEQFTSGWLEAMRMYLAQHS